MKVICILQNAWSNVSRLPMFFEPNEYNKSCKVIRKIVGPDAEILFCNTTPVITATANGHAKIDPDHCRLLVERINRMNCDLVLVCGKQASNAMYGYTILKRTLIIKHPAARDLSNVEIDNYKSKIKLQ